MPSNTDKGYRGAPMEGRTARWYASNTGRDRARIEEQAGEVLAYAPERGDVLEIAPGPGYLSIALARTGRYAVTGVDISATFVQIATERAAAEGVDVDFRQGNASELPYGDDSFDFIVCCAAFKNFSQPARAVAEMRRVLRPGGRALIIDLRPDVTREAVDADVARMRMGAVNRVVTRFVLGRWLARRAHTRGEFAAYATAAGFAAHEVHETPMSLEIVLDK
ncbi:MAG TPA: class I SAM-dependent methyltransferase [Streptosporangiaceae bacterium]|jgi:ubiquinone/menaquinone biosynthesis C-methylase UbiE